MTGTAVITGTTSGIGKAFAHKLAREKYDIVLVARNKQKLEQQARELSEKYGINTYAVTVDLLEADAARTVYNAVQDLGLNVDVLINNAGLNEYGSFLETKLENEIDMITLHIARTTEMMKMFLPMMVENKYGRILNLGSIGSFIACPYDAVYAGTKAYILSVSKGIAAELKGTGVSITTLCPGSTKTQFAAKAGMDKTMLFKFFVMDAEKVANIGYRALMKKRTSVVAGMYSKLLVLSSKIIPPGIINAGIKIMMKSSSE